MTDSRWSTTSGRDMSRTYWLRSSDRGRPGTPTAQSGCASKRSLRGFTISGSIQRPRSTPRAFTRSASRARPPGSLRSSTNQSPSDEVSSSRRPNQPSSSTKSSMPRSRADAASATSRSSPTSKYVASQLLRRIGRGRSRHVPRARRSRNRPWNASDRPPRPSSVHVEDRLRRLEGLAWLEPPAERPRVDPEAQPRRAERIDLSLGEEVARVDERQPDGLTGGLLGRWPPQHEDRVLLMARCAPLAARRAQARLESRLVEAELATPGAGVLDEGPVGIGQVERGAHDGRQRERVRPAVHEPDAARHDRPVAVDRRQHVGGEAARTVDEDDLDGLGLGVVLGVRGGQAVESRLSGSDVVLAIDELEHAAAVGELDRERRLAEVTAAGRRQLAQGRVRHAVRAPDERMALEVGVIATDVERCPEVEMRERAGRQDPHDVAEPAVVEMELAGRGPPFDGHRLSCRIAVVGAGERWARAAPMVRRAAATSRARWGDAPPRGIRACRADRHRASRRRPRPRPGSR